MLLDTDVMVDILRGYPPAINWLESLGNAEIGLPGLVGMELIEGERDRQGIMKLLRFLGKYSLYWPQQDDCQQAFAVFSRARFSHHLGLLDSLIGLTARGLNRPLCTFNQKHYRTILGLDLIQPYEK